ncbi:hypothetical protein ACSQ67_006455 [Phaseolus vulgaris]
MIATATRGGKTGILFSVPGMGRTPSGNSGSRRIGANNYEVEILLTDYGNADSVDYNARCREELKLSLESSGPCKVAFNPVTANSMKKILFRICQVDQCDMTAEYVDLIAKTSGVIAVVLNDAFLLTISFHDPSLVGHHWFIEVLIPYIKDNIERHLKFGMEIALDLANFGTKASIVARTRTRATPFSIYKDSIATSEIDPDKPNQSQSWRTLGARADGKKGKQYNSRQVKIFQENPSITLLLVPAFSKHTGGGGEMYRTAAKRLLSGARYYYNANVGLRYRPPQKLILSSRFFTSQPPTLPDPHSTHRSIPVVTTTETPNSSDSASSSSSTDDDAANPKANYEDLQARVLQASLPYVIKLGWTEAALISGARDVGLSPSIVGSLPRKEAALVESFPVMIELEVFVKPSSLIDVFLCLKEDYSCFCSCYSMSGRMQDGTLCLLLHNYFMDDCLQRLVEKIDSDESLKSLTPSDFISKLIRYRLEMQAPYISTWPQALSIQAQPANVPTSFKQRAVLVDEIWHAAGDTASDIDWYAKRTILGGIYSTTEIYMLTDNSPDFRDTWAFLDARVKDAFNIKKTIQEAQSLAEAVSVGLGNSFQGFVGKVFQR